MQPGTTRSGPCTTFPVKFASSCNVHCVVRCNSVGCLTLTTRFTSFKVARHADRSDQRYQALLRGSRQRLAARVGPRLQLRTANLGSAGPALLAGAPSH